MKRLVWRLGTFDCLHIVGADESFVGEVYKEAMRSEEISSQYALCDFGDNETPGILL